MNASAAAAVSENEELEETPASLQEDVEFLKRSVVSAANMDAIKSKIATTSEYRRKMIQNNHSID